MFLVGYTGLDVPDFGHLLNGDEPYAIEARERNRQHIEGKTVMLERSAIEVDRDGRHLRYVYVDDLMINAVLIYEGMAQLRASVSSPIYMHTDLLYQLQNIAVTKRHGAWAYIWRNLTPRR